MLKTYFFQNKKSSMLHMHISTSDKVEIQKKKYHSKFFSETAIANSNIDG